VAHPQRAHRAAQVLPVNYLRWDVIYSGSEMTGSPECGSSSCAHCGLHPVERADGVVILGELLNEDVVPAYVSVTATLLSKNHRQSRPKAALTNLTFAAKASDSFLIKFPNVSLPAWQHSDDAYVALIAARRTLWIEIEDEQCIRPRALR